MHPPTLDNNRGSCRNDQHEAHHCAPTMSQSYQSKVGEPASCLTSNLENGNTRVSTPSPQKSQIQMLSLRPLWPYATYLSTQLQIFSQ